MKILKVKNWEKEVDRRCGCGMIRIAMSEQLNNLEKIWACLTGLFNPRIVPDIAPFGRPILFGAC